MIYKPCRYCHQKDDCQKFADIQAALKTSGLSKTLTSLQVRCKTFRDGLNPGKRVAVKLASFVSLHDDYEGAYFWRKESPEEHTGTVMKWLYSGKVMVWLDEPIQGPGRQSERIRVRANRLTALSEPDRAVCEECGRPEGQANREDWSCAVCPE